MHACNAFLEKEKKRERERHTHFISLSNTGRNKQVYLAYLARTIATRCETFYEFRLVMIGVSTVGCRNSFVTSRKVFLRCWRNRVLLSRDIDLWAVYIVNNLNKGNRSSFRVSQNKKSLFVTPQFHTRGLLFLIFFFFFFTQFFLCLILSHFDPIYSAPKFLCLSDSRLFIVTLLSMRPHRSYMYISTSYFNNSALLLYVRYAYRSFI